MLRDTDAAALFAAVRADRPLPAEATDPRAGDGRPDAERGHGRRSLNASDRSGLAGEVGETLGSLGFERGRGAAAPSSPPPRP